jgi:GT2 family glycosyltransferase
VNHQPKVNFSVIIPNLNGSGFLPDFLASLKNAIANCAVAKFEVIFVDNGSTDNSVLIFQQTDLSCSKHLIKLDKNHGFAKAVNVGINKAIHGYVCLLNNDLILDSKWFKLIHKSIITREERTVVFCGTVQDRNGNYIESQGVSYDISGKCFQNNHGKKLSIKLADTTLVWGASAAAVVYDKDVVVRAGLFNERFFAYIEDIDLAYRLVKHRYQTICINNATCLHLGGGTSEKLGNLRQFCTYRNWHLLILNNYSISDIILNFPAIVTERLRNLSYFIRSTKTTKLIYQLPYLIVDTTVQSAFTIMNRLIVTITHGS